MRWLLAAAIAAVCLLLSVPVQADPTLSTHPQDLRGTGAGWWQEMPLARTVGRERGKIIPHPPGCPARAFCACGASVRIFGRSIRSLWPTVAWFKFRRAAAAPGRVAVRRGHVFVLERHISGLRWLVTDHNSGGHKSRLHVRSIAGYVIVDPRAGA